MYTCVLTIDTGRKDSDITGMSVVSFSIMEKNHYTLGIFLQDRKPDEMVPQQDHLSFALCLSFIEITNEHQHYQNR